MTITLLTPEEYLELLSIQEKHPILTYQNKGYDGIDMSKLSEEDLKAFDQVNAILKKSIKSFVKFQNFKVSKHKITKVEELVARFQYMYDSHFQGVGYISLRELLNGFDIELSTNN